MNGYRPRAVASVWILAFMMAAAIVPSLPAGSAVAQGIGQANHGGVTFSYDRSVAANVIGQTVPGNTGGGGSVYDLRPAHTLFSFEGYPSKGAWTPQIRVIPFAEYKAAQAGSDIGGALNSLENYTGSDMGQAIPSLPPVGAQRIISEQLAPVAGSGVTGVRFVAAYSQGPVPLTAADITYVFIGLTNDRKFYVEGTFPVALATPLEPPPSPLTAEGAQAYNHDVVAARVRDAGAAGFTPTLDLLDKMMSSVQVGSGTTPGMPKTGRAIDATWLLLTATAASLLTLTVGLAARKRRTS